MDERAGTGDRAGSKLEEREEHEQVWTKLIDLFEQMVDLLGSIEVTPTDFVDIVESGLEGFDLAIAPPAPDQVLVGQVDRTRCPAVKSVFVLGLSEGEFPAAPHETTVLSDRERRELSRRRLELDPDCNRRLLDERLLGYIAFTQPSDRLILSRSVSDDANRPAMPSVFWNRIGELFPGIFTRTIPRSQIGQINQIATPRQFVSGLMHWVRDGQPLEKTCRATKLPNRRFHWPNPTSGPRSINGSRHKAPEIPRSRDSKNLRGPRFRMPIRRRSRRARGMPCSRRRCRSM